MSGFVGSITVCEEGVEFNKSWSDPLNPPLFEVRSELFLQ